MSCDHTLGIPKSEKGPTRLIVLNIVLIAIPFTFLLPVSLPSSTSFDTLAFTIRQPTTAIDYRLRNGPSLGFKILAT